MKPILFLRLTVTAVTVTMTVAVMTGCAHSSQPQQAAVPEATQAAPSASVAAPGPTKRLAAMGIGVSDLEVSAKFYRDTLGMKEIAHYNLSYMNEIVLAFPNGGSAVVLMHWIDGSERNYKDNPIKLVLRVPDPVATAAKIRADGHEIVREPTPAEAVGGAVVGFAKDPDGYLIELLEPANTPK